MRHWVFAILLVVAFLSSWSAPTARAEPDVGVIARKSLSSDKLVQQRGSFPSANQDISSPPTATPPPSSTPLPIPSTGIIWSSSSAGAYLYEEPGLTILLEIPNGESAHLFDEFASYGNRPWTRVSFEEYEGWVDATRIHRLRFEGETFYLVDEDGTYLYAAPQGQPQVWLPEGTPLRFEEAENGWAAVTTLDGESGWILLDRLLPPD